MSATPFPSNDIMSGAKLLRTWMWSDGVAKTSPITARAAARDGKSLVSNWVVTEGVSKAAHENVSARVLQGAGARTPKALLSEWMWTSGIARMTSDSKAARSGSASSALARGWMLQDGATRVPAWVNAESAVGRQGVSKGSLAASWLTTGVVPKFGASGRVALPLAAAVAVAGASYYAKDIFVKGKKTAGLLVRRSSVEAPARLALKYV
jgi:hypothetical protein